MKTSAFDGQVLFDCSFRSVATDRVFFRLSGVWLRDTTLSQSEQNLVSIVALVLSCTRAVEFHLAEDAAEELVALAAFYAWYRGLFGDQWYELRGDVDDDRLDEVRRRFEVEISNACQTAWHDAMSAANPRWQATPASAHPSMLTPQQAADPNL